jgi:hypothetical protein
MWYIYIYKVCIHTHIEQKSTTLTSEMPLKVDASMWHIRTKCAYIHTEQSSMTLTSEMPLQDRCKHVVYIYKVCIHTHSTIKHDTYFCDAFARSMIACGIYVQSVHTYTQEYDSCVSAHRDTNITPIKLDSAEPVCI